MSVYVSAEGINLHEEIMQGWRVSVCRHGITPTPGPAFDAPMVKQEDTPALGAGGAFAPSGFEPRRGHFVSLLNYVVRN